MNRRAVRILCLAVALCCSGSARALTCYAPQAVATGSPTPRLVVQGSTGDFRSVAFSSDGRHVVTLENAIGRTGGDVRVWETLTGREIRRWSKEGTLVTQVQFSRLTDDIVHIALSAGGLLDWQVSTGATKTVVAVDVGVSAFAYTQDERRVILLSGVSSGRKVKEIELPSGTPVDQPISGNPYALQLLPGDRSLLVATADALLLVDQHDFTVRSRVSEVQLSTRPVPSQDGGRVAAGGSDGSINIWPTVGGTRQHWHAHGSNVASLAWNPSDERIASLGDDQLRVWESATGRLVGERKIGFSPRHVAYSPDGQFIGVSTSDRVQFFRSADLTEVSRLEGRATGVETLTFSPDSTLLAIGNVATPLSVWSLKQGRLIRQLRQRSGYTPQPASVQFTPDGEGLLLGQEPDPLGPPIGARLWDWTANAERATFTSPNGGIPYLALSPDGLEFVGGNSTIRQTDGKVRVWKIGEREPVVTLSGPTPMTAVAFAQRGNLVAAVGFEAGRIWNVRTRRTVCDFMPAMPAGPTNLAFSPDGELLAVIGLGWRVYRTRTCQEVPTDTAAGLGVFSAVVFSPDGKHVLTGHTDGSLVLWQTDTFRRVRRLEAQQDQIAALAWSPDGLLVAAGTAAGATQLWRAKEELENQNSETAAPARVTLIMLQSGEWFVVDSDGHFESSDAGRSDGVHWVVGPAQRAISLQSFSRTHFQQGLLSIALGDHAPAAPLADLDFDTPSVVVDTVTLVSGSYDHVDVRARVVMPSPPPTTSYSVVLLRDQRVVAEQRIEPSAPSSGYVEFKDVAVAMSEQGVAFSTFSVNASGVRSDTSPPTSFKLVRPADVWRRRRAYVLAIGVGRNESGLNLSFATENVTAVTQLLERRLSGFEVVTLVMMSGGTGGVAPTKQNIKDVLRALSGEAPPSAALTSWGDKLQPLQPDDLLIFYVSAHGVTVNGEFYLVPMDTGDTFVDEQELRRCAGIAPPSCDDARAFLTRAISSVELAKWLSPVEGEVTLLLDSCYAGAVLGSGFIPAALGSATFGQLAYSRGFLIGAAAQPDQVARGTSRKSLNKSLFVAALGAAADTQQYFDMQQWLTSAAEVVPLLHREYYETRSYSEIQWPVVFDYSPRR